MDGQVVARGLDGLDFVLRREDGVVVIAEVKERPGYTRSPTFEAQAQYLRWLEELIHHRLRPAPVDHWEPHGVAVDDAARRRRATDRRRNSAAVGRQSWQRRPQGSRPPRAR